MTYFKASILLSTETLLEDGSCDPDSYQDQGVVQTVKAATIEELKAKLNKQFDLSKFDVIETDRLEYTCNGVPTSGEMPYIENWNIYVSEVNETGLAVALIKA